MLNVLIALPPHGVDDKGKPLDWDAALRGMGPDAVKTAISAAARWDDLPFISSESAELETDRLAKCTEFEYERERLKSARLLGLRPTVLDRIVKGRRTAPRREQFATSISDPPEPWPEPVDIDPTMEELVAFIRRHIIMKQQEVYAVALWCLFAHLHDVARHSPILAVQSPAPRCGKTTIMRIIRAIVPTALTAANIRVAGVFRVIEKYCPTLLLDEADTYVRDNEELRGILNSGHERAFANTVRVVGDDHEPCKFSTWCPKAIALIGFLPVTLQDRSIVISLRRKTVDEHVDRLSEDNDPHLYEIHSKLARWAKDHADRVRSIEPEVPDGINDRARDNWRTMLAIAEAIDGKWPAQARAAALAISGHATNDLTSSVEVQLLGDIRLLFLRTGAKCLGAKELAGKLAGLEEAPWSEYNRGRPLSARGLAMMLRPFQISSRHTTSGSVYDRHMFIEAWRSYLPPDEPCHDDT